MRTTTLFIALALAGCNEASVVGLEEVCPEIEVVALTNADGVHLSQSYILTAPPNSCVLVSEKSILTVLGVFIEETYICEVCP